MYLFLVHSAYIFSFTIIHELSICVCVSNNMAPLYCQATTSNGLNNKQHQALVSVLKHGYVLVNSSKINISVITDSAHYSSAPNRDIWQDNGRPSSSTGLLCCDCTVVKIHF